MSKYNFKVLVGVAAVTNANLGVRKARQLIILLKPGHVCRQIGLDQCARMLDQAYQQCLRRLDNSAGKHPYNLIVTQNWMMEVNRSKASIGKV